MAEIVIEIASEKCVQIGLALFQLGFSKLPNTVALEKAKQLLLKDTAQIQDQIKSIQYANFKGMVERYKDGLHHLEKSDESSAKEALKFARDASSTLLYDSKNLKEGARLEVWEIHLNSVSMCAAEEMGPQSWLELWNRKLEDFSKDQSKDVLAQYLFGRASASVIANDSTVLACQNYLKSIGYTVMGHLMEIPLHPEKFPFLLSIIPEEVVESLKEKLSASRFFANFGYLYLRGPESHMYYSKVSIDFHFAALSQEPLALGKEPTHSKIVLFKDSSKFVCELGFTANSLAFDPKNRMFVVTTNEKNGQTTLHRLKLLEETANDGVTMELFDKKSINMPGATVFCTNTGKFLLVSVTTFPLVARYNSFQDIPQKVPKTRKKGYKGDKSGCLGVAELHGEILAALVPNRGGHLDMVGQSEVIQIQEVSEVQSVHQLGTEHLAVIIWVENGQKYFGVYDFEENRSIMKVIIL